MSFQSRLPKPEVPQDGQESVWEYPRPPIVRASNVSVKVQLAGIVIAESNKSVQVLETSHPPTYYLPPDDVDQSYFTKIDRSSFCEWKGNAIYWDVSVNKSEVRAGAWSYDQPTSAFKQLAGYFSFYPASFECFVDNKLVIPQPGQFYGGWVTEDVVGPFKGVTGSQWW